MNIQPEKSIGRNDLYQTADALFSRSACTHLIPRTGRYATQSYPIEHIHLERLADSFRATFNIAESNMYIPGPTARIEAYENLDAFYQHHQYGREAIWQDITDYPALPYHTRYEPLAESINVTPESSGVYQELLGKHLVYGRVEITDMSSSVQRCLRPQGTWLIIEYPERIVRSFRWAPIEGKAGKISRVIRDVLRGQRTYSKREPGFLVVYAQPPRDWREAEQHTLSIETAH